MWEKKIPAHSKSMIQNDHFREMIEIVVKFGRLISDLIKAIEEDRPNLSYFPLSIQKIFTFLKTVFMHLLLKTEPSWKKNWKVVDSFFFIQFTETFFHSV